MTKHSGNGRFKSVLLALAIASALDPAQAAPVEATELAIRFNIPGQRLVQALSVFAEQSGLQLLYNAQLAEGKQAPALMGSFLLE